MPGARLPWQAMATETFPAWLDRMLKQRAWTRTLLAERLGHADTRTIRRWLAGKNRPREAELVRLYELFGEDYAGETLTSDDPRVSLVDEVTRLREDVKRLEQAFRELSLAREDRYDALVAGQEAVVEAVERVARELQDAPSGSATSGKPPAPNRRRQAS
jgi:transcriptional regulator with XRE-family HTH domain